MPIQNLDIIQLTYFGRCFNQRIMLTHFYRYAGDTSDGTYAADLDDMIDQASFGGAWGLGDAYMACLPPQYAMEEMRAQVIAPGRQVYVGAATPGVVGTHVSNATVANDAAALTLRGPLARRSEIATKHIGPAPDNVSAAGLLTGGYVALMTSLANSLSTIRVGFMPGSTLTPIIYHRGSKTASIIFGIRIGAQSRVQRRRTVGLGE